MTNENIQITKTLFENPLGFLKLGNPQVHDNMTVIPIIVHDDKFIDFISIKEAEELGIVEIIETGSVNQLEVINKGDRQVLIPFGMTVHGGKQDRTIWEPILLPKGGKQRIFNSHPGSGKKKYTIPAKCIEQSRWNYTGGRGFKSAKRRMHPNIAYEAISSGGQGAVWQEIQFHRSEMKYAANIAPTQSYLDMTKISEKQTSTIVKNFNVLDNQCGIAVFINGEFIGIEFYANPEVWKMMSEDILQAFAIEALRFKDKPKIKEKVAFHDEFISIMHKLDLKLSERKGIGLGNVVEFNSDDNKWRGITLVHNQSLVQFYLVSKRGGTQNQHRPGGNVQFQTIVDQRYTI